MSLNQRQLHFTTAGLRTQVVEIAENFTDPVSKRWEAIRDENVALDRNIAELDQGTKARNRSFQERIDEVWGMTAGWEAKLKTEAIESVESILNLKAEYQRHIQTFEEEFLADINNTFDKIDKEMIPNSESYVTKVEEDMRHYYKDVAPPAIEAQAGEVNRKLRKTYETFHIEQQKEIKRDQKFVNRVNKHFQHTAQRHNDEEALQDACFHNLEDDVIEYYRPISRMLPRRIDLSTQAILSLRKLKNDISRTRTSEDLDVLDTVIETQQLLQQIIILHFGVEDEEYNKQRQEALDQRIKFPKLTKRLLTKKCNEERAIAQSALEAQDKDVANNEGEGTQENVQLQEGMTITSPRAKTPITSSSELLSPTKASLPSEVTSQPLIADNSPTEISKQPKKTAKQTKDTKKSKK